MGNMSGVSKKRKPAFRTAYVPICAPAGCLMVGAVVTTGSPENLLGKNRSVHLKSGFCTRADPTVHLSQQRSTLRTESSLNGATKSGITHKQSPWMTFLKFKTG